jgi:hypothetical protein
MFNRVLVGEITLTSTGTKTPKIQANRIAGTGTLRASANKATFWLRVDYV